MSGRTALVTGSTDGHGRLVALGLAERGWRVLFHGRDAGRGQQALEEDAVTLERLQAMSTELEPLPSALPETRDELVYVVNPRCAMSSGKVIAQVAHAAVLADAELSVWSPSTARGVRPEESVFDALCGRDDLAARVVDAGLTEVPPGTVTVLALRPGPRA